MLPPKQLPDGDHQLRLSRTVTLSATLLLEPVVQTMTVATSAPIA